MRFLKDELADCFSGNGMTYEKVSIMVAVIVTLLVTIVYSNNYIKDGRVVVIDLDNSRTSRDFITKIDTSPYIKVKAVLNVPTDPKSLLFQDNYVGVLYIPDGFEKNQYAKSENNIGMFYDNTNTGRASNLRSGLSAIIAAENQNIASSQIGSQGLNGEQMAAVISNISVKERLLFNPTGSSSSQLAIGMLFFFSSMFFVFATTGMISLLRLKHKWEEQLLKGTPFDLMLRLTPYCFCLIVSLFVGLGVGRIVGDLIFCGNVLFLLFAMMLHTLALGCICLLMGWNASDPGEAISRMIFYLPAGFMLGGYTNALDTFPDWVNTLSHVFPLRWFLPLTRDIMLRDASFMDIAPELGGYMLYTGILALIVCIFFYRERNKLLKNADLNAPDIIENKKTVTATQLTR